MSKIEYSESRSKLWSYFNDECKLPLLESELDDVINAVKEYIDEQEKATTDKHPTGEEQNDVSPLVCDRRELLIGFEEWYGGNDKSRSSQTFEEVVDEYLAKQL